MIRRLPFIASTLIALLLSTATEVRGAVIWQSYSDEARTIQSDYFNEYQASVYMKAIGLSGTNKLYRVRYYDADGILLQTEDTFSNKGELLSQIMPASFPSSSPNIWRADFYKLEPKEQLLATDNFEVTPATIPEFPIMLSGIVVSILCSGIYIGFRNTSGRRTYAKLFKM